MSRRSYRGRHEKATGVRPWVAALVMAVSLGIACAIGVVVTFGFVR
jgi:hypothetical protein